MERTLSQIRQFHYHLRCSCKIVRGRKILKYYSRTRLGFAFLVRNRSFLHQVVICSLSPSSWFVVFSDHYVPVSSVQLIHSRLMFH